MIARQKLPLMKTVIGFIFFGFVTTFGSQMVDLSGTVYSMYGFPLPGMVVTLKNTNLKDTTDSNGTYHLTGEGTSVITALKSPANNASGLCNFLHLDNNSRIPLSPGGARSPDVIYDLTGKAIPLKGTGGQLSRNMAPGVYFTKGDIGSNRISYRTSAQTRSSVDNITVTFKDSVRGTAAVTSSIDTLDIQVTDKLFDRWPQVHAGDQMPENPGLKVGSYVPSDAVTRINTDGYVVMLIGSNRPSCITDDVAKRDLQKLDEGLREVIEVAGFPAFPEWKNGNYMNWVILNSGISGATLSGEGGHQGNRWGHMNFESTKECPCTWDAYQSGGALHECVHALIAELWVYNNEASGWVHESFNNYLTTMTNALVRKKYSIGWTASLWLNMAHIPLESMGLARDGHVAGPADQGMNGRTYYSDQHRYGGEIFFLGLSQVMGRGFNISLFTTPVKNNSKSILQIFHSIYGDDAYAAAIMSFASKGALLDFEEWTEFMRSTMKSNWNNNYWFYLFPDGDGTSAFSAPAGKAPHHQGRNVIPIKLSSGATSITVEFTPDTKGSKGTAEKMLAQIVYRDKNDKPVYGPVFSNGQRTYAIPGGARNDIVNLVVAATQPNATTGSDDGSGKGFDAQETFNYKARIVSGGSIAPTTTRPW